jgi:predicted transcriptional regulator
MAAVVKGGLEFGLSPLFIATVANGALTVHNASAVVKGGSGFYPSPIV